MDTMDHTGGVPSFCDINRNAKIYIHEKALEETFGMENGKLEEEPCSIRWTKEQRQSIKNRLILTKKVTWLSDDIVISGTIPKIEAYQPTEVFLYKRSRRKLRT